MVQFRTPALSPRVRTVGRYGISAGINFASIFLALAARLVVLFQFGATAFGVFAVWYNNAMLFGLVGTAGYQNFALRELAATQARNDAEATRAISADGVRITMLTGLTAGLAGAGFYFLAQDGTALGAASLTFVTALLAVLNALSAVHRARGWTVVGVVFDRLLYQILFIALLAAGSALSLLNGFAEPLFLACVGVAAGASIWFLLDYSDVEAGRFFSPIAISSRLRELAPYCAMVAVFTANARYLLGIAGIVFTGEMLGKVGFDFTAASTIALPTATFNLVFGPPIARAIASGTPREARRRSLQYVILNVVSSVSVAVVILIAYAPAIDYAGIAWDGDYRLIGLLALSSAISGATNGLIIISQFQGSATRTAWVLAAVLIAKLAIGGALIPIAGFGALVAVDIALGALFFGLILSGALRDFARAAASNTHGAA